MAASAGQPRTGDTQNVSLPVITEGIGRNLSRDTLLVEGTNRVLILEFEGLLRAVRRERDVQLQNHSGSWSENAFLAHQNTLDSRSRRTFMVLALGLKRQCQGRRLNSRENQSA